ncbi:hypothetical protein V6N13_109427 [Hibiscus sabdariffa]
MLECLVSSMPLEDQRSVKKGLNDFEVVSHVVDEDMDDDGAFFVRVEALSGAHSVHGICWWKVGCALTRKCMNQVGLRMLV